MTSNNVSKQFENWEEGRIEHLERLLEIYYRNLNYTEEQIARNFSAPSIALLNQRDDLNKAIVTTKSELTVLSEDIDFVAPTPVTKLALEPTLWFYQDGKLINLIELESLNWAASVYLGRASDCQISIKQEYMQVSRHHAQLIKVGNAYVLKDGSSTYGTYINGIEIDQDQGKTLQDGDQVVLGALSGRDNLPTKRACFFIFRKD